MPRQSGAAAGDLPEASTVYMDNQLKHNWKSQLLINISLPFSASAPRPPSQTYSTKYFTQLRRNMQQWMTMVVDVV